MDKKQPFSKKDIVQLKWNDAIRFRPRMYIGHLDQKGFMYTLKNIILSYPVAENQLERVEFEIIGNRNAILTLYHPNSRIYNNWSKLVFHPTNPFHMDLNVLNALSSEFSLTFFGTNNINLGEQEYQCGILKKGHQIEEITCDKLKVEFILDDEIWGQNFQFNETYISHEIRGLAYLKKDTKFIIKYQVEELYSNIIYHFKKGLNDKLEVEKINGSGGTYFDTYTCNSLNNFEMELAFAFREYSVDEPILKSYANDYNTSENGSHVDGLLKGLTYGVMKYFQKNNLVDKYRISEKGIQENLIAMINVRLKNARFSGCVKNKLANPEIIEPIANFVSELLYSKIERDEESTKKIIRKFEIP